MQEWSTLKKLIWLFAAVVRGGASWAWSVVTGNAPLTLSEAVAHGIARLTQYGLCTQSTTPTPSSPVDIVCNNGALKCGANERNAHFVQYLNAYIKSSNRQITSYNGNSVVTYDCEVGKTYRCYDAGTSGNAVSVNVGYSDGVPTIGTTYSADDFESIPCPDGYRTAGLIFTAKKRYVTFIFRYDGDSSKTPESMLSQMIFTEVGKEVGTLYTDGTPEVLTVSGKNEANVEDYSLSFTNRYYVDKAIGVTLEAGVTYTFSCDIECSITPFGISVGVGNDVVYLVDIVTKPNQTNGRIFATFTPSATALSNYSKLYVRIPRFTEAKTGTVSVSKIQLERSSSATDYEPYVTPQTVTDIPMLLSVGDTKDDGEVISGSVTHRIGCHVFDGTETFSKSSAYGKAFLLNAAYAAWGADKTKAVLCTHFLGLPQKSSAQDDNTCFFNSTGHFYFRVTDNSDTDAFKAWLAAQYAAGTPVIVWFVLAEETTEQTTAHALHTTQGENVVSVTANVSPISIEVEYAKTQA